MTFRVPRNRILGYPESAEKWKNELEKNLEYKTKFLLGQLKIASYFFFFRVQNLFKGRDDANDAVRNDKNELCHLKNGSKSSM